MSIDNTARALLEAMMPKKQPGAYDTTATVSRVEENILWVHIPGGIDETPVRKTIDAKAGDEVQIRVGGGRAWATGNESAPPTDDTTALLAKLIADDSLKRAIEALATLKLHAVEIEALRAAQIETKWIQSPDYTATEIPLIYPDDDLYPDSVLYPSDGNLVISGFAIDLEHAIIYGAFYSEQISTLQAQITTLQAQIAALETRIYTLENKLVYPIAVPATLSAASVQSVGALSLEPLSGLEQTTLDQTDEEEI